MLLNQSTRTKEVVPEFPGVGQGLDDAVHEAGVAQVDQSSKTRQTHFLLLLVFVVLLAGGEGVGHGLHHAGGLRLKADGAKTAQLSSASELEELEAAKSGILL